jgi:EmrB/QacA subfamily drug resistance transporter
MTEREAAEARTALAVSAAGVFLAFLDLTIVNIAFPDVLSDFAGASLDDLSWVLNGYNVVFAALLVPAGRIADRLGRKRVFLLGVCVFTAASGACGLAPSAAALVAARIAQALGAALMIPASLALVLAAAAPGTRPIVVSAYGAAAAVASGIGPSLGGLLVEASGWRLVFLINVPIGIAALLAGRRLLVESRAGDEPARADVAGGLALVVAIGALALGIVKSDDWGWSSRPTLGCLAVAVAVGAAFTVRATRHAHPLVELDLFRIRSFSAGNLATGLFATGFYAGVLCNVLFLTAVWRYSVLDAALAVSPAPLVAAIAAVPAGRLAARFGERAVALPGVVLFVAAAVWLLARVGSSPDFVGDWLPGAACSGVGIGFAFPALASAALREVPDGRSATASAVNAMVRQLGAVLGIALLVAVVGADVVADLDRFQRGWLLAAVAGAGAIVPALAIPGRSGARSPGD